ncbi:glycosyltransferase [Caballeronia sp. AZ10_KS36]|uniref:glycosyltransferase n=1 Tax=Caballeronia sp. AZ10_KS36 TaxID=2921757 RepID=UPI002028E81C|nr:glycosyltransferase [Caballeronia sp. AZ10_KS36]
MNDVTQARTAAASSQPACIAPGPAANEQVPAESAQSNCATDAHAVRAELARLVAHARTARLAQDALAEAQSLVGDHAQDADSRLLLLQLMEMAGHAEGTLDAWHALSADCPDHAGITRAYALRLVKEKKVDAALEHIDRCMPESLDDASASLARAELLADVRAHEASDALFERLIARHDRRDIRVAFAKRLGKRGRLARAVAVLEPVAASLAPDSKAGRLAAALASDYAFYRQYEPDDVLASADFKIVAMKHAILSFRQRAVRCADGDGAKAIALLTGSLGPGGAERQLTRLACQLQKEALHGGASTVASRVEVLVRQHTEATRGPNGQRLDFFLGTLNDAGVPVTQINDLPVVADGDQSVTDAKLLRMLGYLPPPVHYGVGRLAPYFRERRFDVVSLWQDGTCLFGALAALLAGVPVIHLVFRGLPPNIRRERDRPEYAVLYRALAEVPGVHFVCNSRTGAQAYAAWLDLPLARFHVLYNGVPELDTTGSIEDVERWEAFAKKTADATETIGGVFRFEPDKRPSSWIRLAARYLKKRPRARFVIVGDGRLQEKAVELANELGISGRLLFAGLSSHVGYWYSKMDAKVLLSRFEGLPNVLIEAQMLGVATLSTPAGGAGECFVDGVTGHLLECAEQPDLQAACDKLAALVDRCKADEATCEHARHRARMLFSVNAMLSKFAELCASTVQGAESIAQADEQESPLVA